MAVIKFVDNMYDDDKALHTVCHYVINPAKAIACDGNYVIPEYAYEMMNHVRYFYNVTDGRTLIHIIVATYKTDKITANEFLTYVDILARSFSCNQVLYAIHNESYLHAHIVVNAVNFRTGTVMNDITRIRNQFIARCRELFSIVRIVS